MIPWLMEIAEMLEAGDLHHLSVNLANGEEDQEAWQVLQDHQDPDPHGIWSLLIFQDVTTLMTVEPAIGANLNKVEMGVAVLLQEDRKVSCLISARFHRGEIAIIFCLFTAHVVLSGIVVESTRFSCTYVLCTFFIR